MLFSSLRAGMMIDIDGSDMVAPLR
jgi:hypothetical protein